jgi:hypothetical protein
MFDSAPYYCCRLEGILELTQSVQILWKWMDIRARTRTRALILLLPSPYFVMQCSDRL